jgi:hypothetical protein
MTWSSRGSLGERMRALEIRETLISKQDPMGMSAGVDPTTAVSTAPLAQALNAIDSGFADMSQQITEAIGLLSQTRASGIEPQVTIALQQDLAVLRSMVEGLQAPLAGIRQGHASLVQMQPMGPIGNDPMMASAQQQPPMNMPAPGMQGMGGGPMGAGM